MRRSHWAILGSALLLFGCKESVVDVIPVSSLTIEGGTTPLSPGTSVQLSASVAGPGGESLRGRTVTFSGNNNTVATVTAAGLVQALTAGNVTVTATAEGMTATRTITVTDPCLVFTALTLASPVAGTLNNTSDCRVSNFVLDNYSLVSVTNQFTSVRLAATQFDPFLTLRDSANNTLAFNNDISATDRTALITFFGPVKTYRVEASTFTTGQSGAYTLTPTTSAAFDLTGCQPFWLVNSPGQNYTLTNFTVTNADCATAGTGGTFFSDRIFMFLRSGQTITVTMESTSLNFDPFLIICNTGCTQIAQDNNGGGGTNSRLVFTAGSTGSFFIDAGTALVNQVGTYRLTVSH